MPLGLLEMRMYTSSGNVESLGLQTIQTFQQERQLKAAFEER
jgi:hypothetical protein